MSLAESTFRAIRRPGLKAVGVAFLTLLMSIPLILVAVIVDERKGRAAEARQDVARSWGGGAQLVAGPFLVIPIAARVMRYVGGRDAESVEHQHVVFLPARVEVATALMTESRMRGIFSVTVYKSEIAITGRFDAPDVTRHLKAGDEVLWKDAFLSMAVTDNRGFTEVSALEWGPAGASQRAAFEPSPGLEIVSRAGAHAPVPRTGDSGPFQFRMSFGLKGSEAIRFLPIGQTTVLALKADWPHPSFQGAYLPNDRTITGQGFTARWEIPNLARSFPQSWRQAPVPTSPVQASPPVMHDAAFGVSLIEGVDFYQKVSRAVKYAILFIGFTFLTFFLFEMLTGGRMHPVQYLLVGAAQCTFYVLLLSFAEHIGFLPAYALAAGATVALIACYGGLSLRSFRLFLAILTVLLVIYALLYSVLEMEDHAMLAGALAAFAAIAITMFVTLRVNWFGSEPAAASDRS